MTLKHINRPIDGCVETRPTERINGLESPEPQCRHEMRPGLRALFNARWKRNEPGYQFLADR